MTKIERKCYMRSVDGLQLLTEYRTASRRYDDCTVSGDEAGMKAAEKHGYEWIMVDFW